MTQQELANVARKRAKEKAGFWVHLAIYIGVNTFLVVEWWIITGGSGFFWPMTTIAGWGVGIVAHFLGVFAGKRYVDRETRKESQRLRQQHG